MKPDRWSEIKIMIKSQFGILHQEVLMLEEPEKGEKEVIEFESPMGKMRLEFVTKPILLDKKTHGSRRMGSQAAVEYVYSDTEVSHHFHAWRWDSNADDWQQIDMPRGDFTF